MKVKHVDKHYLYHRDYGKCFFCGKELIYGKMSIDHYLPRSKGGTDDVFNLVTSCKNCNGTKRNTVPEDIEKRHLEWFIQGVLARKILAVSLLRVPNSELDQRIQTVVKSYASGDYTIFESDVDRFFVKDNTIFQISQLNQTLIVE
jgi:CRISPR/Cas system Type II protein with McrA/HNH and RuvC-like nuclease domain